jgi:hypothetical protein
MDHVNRLTLRTTIFCGCGRYVHTFARAEDRLHVKLRDPQDDNRIAEKCES